MVNHQARLRKRRLVEHFRVLLLVKVHLARALRADDILANYASSGSSSSFLLRTKISKSFTLFLHTFTLLSFSFLALFLKSLLLQADSLLPLELDAEVDLLHDASVESNAAIEFLDSD